jgi:ABC-2 type transport system ATP-binding protein
VTLAAERTPSGSPGLDDVIVADSLTKVYPGDVLAVDGLDLTVRRGEVFGLLGPNGAGKSTTAGMLTTRVVPTSGRAWVGGVDVVTDPVGVKRVIGVVPQTNTLDRSLTVRENLVFHGRYFGMGARQAGDAAGAWIDRIKLNRFADAPVASLSGGMAQRLMLARAVMHRPAVLFLDEPTSGLDPQSRLALYEIVGELNAEGQTVLLTTHYMEEADQLCERLAIIDHGRVLAVDTPAGLKRSVGAGAVVSVSATGDLDELADRLGASVAGASLVRRVGDVVQLTFDRSEGVLPVVVSAVDAAGATLTDLHVSEPTLETVFIELTGKELRD